MQFLQAVGTVFGWFFVSDPAKGYLGRKGVSGCSLRVEVLVD